MREELERKEKQVGTERSAEDLAKSKLKEELDRLRRRAAEKRAATAAATGAAAAAAAAGVKRSASEYELVSEEPSTTGGDEGAPPAMLQEQLARTLKVQWDASIGEYT